MDTIVLTDKALNKDEAKNEFKSEHFFLKRQQPVTVSLRLT